MGKHAYLIMAHNQPSLLMELISLLDHNDNDIFIHIDKKSNILTEDLYSAADKSNIYFVENNISVTWGSYSQIKAELLLLEMAFQTDDYIFYHLLTGSDLPIKPIDEINEFYSKNIGKLFIAYANPRLFPKNYEYRLKYRQFFLDYVGKKRNIFFYLNKSAIKLQQIFCLNKIFEGEFCFGSAYWDIDKELVEHILNNKTIIEKEFRYSFCCDEVFVHTIVWNNQRFRNRLYKNYLNNGLEGNLRWMDFTGSTDGSPKSITPKDIEQFIDSGLFFARKFDENESNEAIDLVKSLIHNR